MQGYISLKKQVKQRHVEKASRELGIRCEQPDPVIYTLALRSSMTLEVCVALRERFGDT